MSRGIHARPFVRDLALIAVLLATLAVIFLPASPAHAHDELLGSDPAAGAAVESLPAQISFTFSGAISREDGASEVSVTDAAGTELADGAPTAQDNVLTQPLAGEASGTLTVLWKTVSSDGHPISGEFDFTVSGGPAPTQTTTPEPTQTTEPSGTPEPSPSSPPADAGSSPWPWVLLALVLLAAGGAVTSLLVSRSRREKALRAASGPGSEPPAAH